MGMAEGREGRGKGRNDSSSCVDGLLFFISKGMLVKNLHLVNTHGGGRERPLLFLLSCLQYASCTLEIVYSMYNVPFSSSSYQSRSQLGERGQWSENITCKHGLRNSTVPARLPKLTRQTSCFSSSIKTLLHARPHM